MMELGQDEILTGQEFLLHIPLLTREKYPFDQRAGCIANIHLNFSAFLALFLIFNLGFICRQLLRESCLTQEEMGRKPGHGVFSCNIALDSFQSVNG